MDRVGTDHVRGERAASANPIKASNQHQKRFGGEGRNGPSPPNSKQTRGTGKYYQICSKAVFVGITSRTLEQKKPSYVFAAIFGYRMLVVKNTNP